MFTATVIAARSNTIKYGDWCYVICGLCQPHANRKQIYVPVTQAVAMNEVSSENLAQYNCIYSSYNPVYHIIINFAESGKPFCIIQ